MNALQEQQNNDLKTENIKIQTELEFSKEYIVKLEKKKKSSIAWNENMPNCKGNMNFCPKPNNK